MGKEGPAGGVRSAIADLRVAVVHDWLTGMRGGERCLEDFLLVLPRAEIHTLFHFPGAVSPLIESRPIRTAPMLNWLASHPRARSRYRWLLPLFPKAVRELDLSRYDLIVSLSHCVAKGAGEGQGVRRIAYTFTPMRYLWDQSSLYFNRERTPAALLPLIRLALAALRRWDRSVHPDRYLAISHFVAERIRRVYGREAPVIHPPVDLARLPPPTGENDGGYYLVVSALAPYKRIGDAVDACRRLGRKLVIVGTGEDDQRLRQRAGPETRFLGWLPDDEIAKLYRGCRAFLLPGEEDFGITPLEAMASGRPVIALGRGGVVETVVDLERANGEAPTGILYREAGAEPLADAILSLERLRGSFDPAKLRERAARFDRPRFRDEVRRALEDFVRGG